ncbi:MAG: glycosyltransferase [Acidobacteriaceae bacterium]
MNVYIGIKHANCDYMATIPQRYPGKTHSVDPIKSTKPRILLLIDEMKSITDGGTERQILQIARLLTQNDFSVTLATLRGTSWLTENIAGCPVYHANIGSLLTRRGVLGISKFIAWMRHNKFHVMTTFFAESNCLGAWLAILSGIPALVGARRNLGTCVAPQWKALLRISNRRVDRFHANCEAVRQHIMHAENIAKDRIEVVYNGIDLTRYECVRKTRQETRRELGIPDNALVYGMVSGLRPEKRAKDFLEAARLVIQAHESTHIIIVGDGEQENELKEFVCHHHLSDRIHFVGAQTDVRPYLAVMDVGILTSVSEGLSNSVLEYLASGLPVIATDVGGNMEAIGQAGILVPAMDVDALAAAMRRIQDDDLRSALSLKALEQIHIFSMEKAQHRLKFLYLSLLQEKTSISFPEQEK